MGLLDADVKQQEIVLGEDTVELLTVIEDSFGVELCNDESVLGKSVREFARYISRRSEYPRTQQCLSSAAFYRMRRALLSLITTSRDSIKPKTRLELLFPWSGRKSLWSKFEATLNLKLPPLIYPAWLLVASLVLAIAFSVITGSVLKGVHIEFGVIGVALYSFVSWLLLIVLLIPFARGFPKDCNTFGDLATLALARNYETFAAQYGSSSEDQILTLLRRLIASEVGMNLTEITPETLIPRGLNIE